jgi:hypothetical protein
MLPSITNKSGAGGYQSVGSEPRHPLTPLAFDSDGGAEELIDILQAYLK